MGKNEIIKEIKKLRDKLYNEWDCGGNPSDERVRLHDIVNNVIHRIECQ